jgi:hypothetical protein
LIRELIKSFVLGYAVAFATAWLLSQTQAFSNSKPWLSAMGPAIGVAVGRWWQLRGETVSATRAVTSEEVENG